MLMNLGSPGQSRVWVWGVVSTEVGSWEGEAQRGGGKAEIKRLGQNMDSHREGLGKPSGIGLHGKS